MGAPLVEAEQDSSIRIDDLPKVVMGGKGNRLTEQRLVPSEASRHVAYTYDRPNAFLHPSPPGYTVAAVDGTAQTEEKLVLINEVEARIRKSQMNDVACIACPAAAEARFAGRCATRQRPRSDR